MRPFFDIFFDLAAGLMVFVCYLLLLKEANIQVNFICFDRNLDHPHIDVVTFVPRKQPKKPFSHKTSHRYVSDVKFVVTF